MEEIIHRRGEMLARLVLGRISGVEVQSAPYPSMGDLLVNVGVGVFIVEVKAARNLRSLIGSDGAPSKNVEKSLKRFGSASVIPVLALMFDVSSDSGFFCWVVAPSEEKHVVVRPKELRLTAISNKCLEKEISRVRDWYG